jgi:glutathione S-transferase
VQRDWVLKLGEKTLKESMPMLRVFTFSPDWGLPSAGPFAIKLLAWLELAKIPYEQISEDNPRKGPKGKNPWIEIDGERIGDSELIIELLSRRFGIDLDAGLSNEQKAIGLAWRRTFEEHFHQVLEWELFQHPAGAAYMRASLGSKMPLMIGPMLFTMLRSHLRKQLYARGIARHPPEVIAAKGRADVDALADFLEDRPFLLAERPSTADAAVFGLLAPMVYWPMQTPVASHAKSVEVIAHYCDRMRQRCFKRKGNRKTYK